MHLWQLDQIQHISKQKTVAESVGKDMRKLDSIELITIIDIMKPITFLRNIST